MKRIIAVLLLIVLLMTAIAPLAFARAGGGGGAFGRTHRFVRRIDAFNVLNNSLPIGAYYLTLFVYLLLYCSITFCRQNDYQTKKKGKTLLLIKMIKPR